MNVSKSSSRFDELSHSIRDQLFFFSWLRQIGKKRLHFLHHLFGSAFNILDSQLLCCFFVGCARAKQNNCRFWSIIRGNRKKWTQNGRKKRIRRENATRKQENRINRNYLDNDFCEWRTSFFFWLTCVVRHMRCVRMMRDCWDCRPFEHSISVWLWHALASVIGMKSVIKRWLKLHRKSIRRDYVRIVTIDSTWPVADESLVPHRHRVPTRIVYF